MNTSTSPLYGGIHLPSIQWSVLYDCFRDDASVEPDAHAQAWTKTAVGSPTVNASNGMLSLATALASGGCLYSFDVAGFETWDGAFIEAFCYIPSAESETEYGSLLALELGDAAAAAYLRADGVNLSGAETVAVDMTGWHTVRLGLHGAEARLWVDGWLMQSYGFSYLTTNRRAIFGIAADHGPASSVWRYVRARPFWTGEAFGSDAYMTIGPTAMTVTDLAVGSTEIVPVDHTAAATFTLAEPPEITWNDGSNPYDQGVVVRVLASTDGTGFEAEVYNESYTADQGYGSGLPDLLLQWTRRGLVAP